MEEWKEYKLGEITNMKNGKKRPQNNGVFPVYGGNGIMDYSDSYNAENAIIVGRVGAYCGCVYKCESKCWVSDNAISIFAKDIADTLFLYYLMTTLDFHHHHIGGAQPLMTQDIIGDFTVSIPPLSIQHQIIQVLKSLDDKIEVNKRINDNLEQQAQALFKSWFVDNPDSNWKKISLSEVASFVGGYSYTGKELTDFSNVAMATIKNFMRNGGFKAEGFKGINPSAKLKECHYANLFDILVAHTDLTQNADVIGNAELLLTCGKYNSIIFSMDLVKVLPKEIFPYSFLLAAMLKNKMFKGHCLGYINGTTVLHLNKKALPEFEIRKPSDSEAKIMNETLAPYYKRMAKLLQETDKLISLRDTLLPKLMSGELKINDINN